MSPSVPPDLLFKDQLAFFLVLVSKVLNSLADVIWPMARAFAPSCAGCCSAEDRPSVMHNFKPVSQATNMPANQRQLPSTSPFVSAVTIVERRG